MKVGLSAVTLSLLSGAIAVVEFKDATPAELVQLLAPSLGATNAKLTGHSDCAKIFSKGRLAVRGQPFPDSGVVLSTGRARNLDRQTGGATGVCFGRPGDSDLQAIAGFQTRDACVLEFDFTSAGDDLFFNYVFASEEYPEAVDSPINDEFALFLNGQNLARIPGSMTTIGIKNINKDTNPEYFNDNDPDEFELSNAPYPYFQPDGFTTMLTATGHTNASDWNHVKLVIADGGDCQLDSWLLIEKSSFTFTPPPCGFIQTVPRLEPVSMGSQLGGTVIKIKSLPFCTTGDNSEVYCRFEGFATSMDEVVQGILASPGMIECVAPYAGIASAVVVSFAFHDPQSGRFDKFTASWTAAHKEFMYFDDEPQVAVGTNQVILQAGEVTTVEWDETALTTQALESLDPDQPPIGLTSDDLEFSIEVVAFDDNEAQAFQVIQNVTGVTGGTSSLSVDDSAIGDYTQNFGAGPMAIVMVRVVASYNSRIGAIASSGLIGVFPAAVTPKCNPATLSFCDGIKSLPVCPPTVSYVKANLDFFPDEACSWGRKGPGCSSFIADVGGCFRAYGPGLTGQRCCYSAAGALLPGEFIGAPGLEGPGTADCVAAGRHIFANALHFGYDVVPHYLCCTKDPTQCFRYYLNRPSANGVLGTYEQPTLPGWAFGEPHIRTLDGVDYDFNGAGEYVAFCGVENANDFDSTLVECTPDTLRLTGTRSALSVHVRFAAITTGTGEATVPVGVAIEDPQHQSGLRAIAVVPHPTRRIDVLDGGTLLKFQDDAVDGTTKVLYLSSGARITISGNLANLRAIAVVTIEMPSGLRLKILEKGGVMFPNLEVHAKFKSGNSVGLMGFVDGDPSNDLTASDGTETDATTASPEDIFQDFGTTWRIDNVRWSLFQGLNNYETFGKYDDPEYVPSFSAPTVSVPLQQKADAACALIKDDFIRESCIFDIKVSGDVDLFRASSEMAFNESKSLQVRVNTLPKIASSVNKAVVTLGVRTVFPFMVSDAETAASNLKEVALKQPPGSTLFSLSFDPSTGKGSITFAGAPTVGVYPSWLSVTDEFNSVLSTFVVNVWTKGVTDWKTCAKIEKPCRCAWSKTSDIRSCVTNDIVKKGKCVLPGIPRDNANYIDAVVKKLVSMGKSGCRR